MDFTGVTIDTADQVSAVIAKILALDISPDDKRTQIAHVVRTVARHYHGQLYGAVSEVLDSAAMTSAGLADPDGQIDRLAQKIVRNDALGRNTSTVLVTEYYNTVLGRLQAEAFANANSMQRHPTLTRTANIGKPDCEWCVEKSGVYTNPKSEDFGRHDRCDCVFEISGYKTRNGLLKNYKKVRRS